MAYSTDIKDYHRRAWGLGDRVPFEPGGAVRKSELIKVLADSGITTSSSNFAKVVKDLGVKVNKTHPLHRKTQPIYIEPTKEKLVIMKKKHTKNQLQSFHTGPGREAYELREKRILELLNEGDKTLSEIDATIRKEFGTSSKTTIIKLKKDLKIKLPDAREKGIKNPKTAKIIKDLNILKKSTELNNLILKPNFSLIGDLPELEKIATKILPKTNADPVRRVGQLLLAYSGEDLELQKYIGEVSDDLVKASDVVKTKMNKSNRLLSTLQKIAAEKRAAMEIGKEPAFFGSQRKRLHEIVNSLQKGLGMEVDEIKPIGGAKAKTSIYNIFTQGLKADLNQRKGETLDRLTQNAELDLQNAKTKAEKIKIKDTYNAQVKKFVEEWNRNLKPGQLPVRAFEISFDKPSNTIKNKAAYNKYKFDFDDIYTKHGYSFKVPEDVRTNEQAKIFLKTKKGKNFLKKQINLKGSRFFSLGPFGEGPIIEDILKKQAEGKTVLESLGSIAFLDKPIRKGLKRWKADDQQNLAYDRANLLRFVEEGKANRSTIASMAMKDPDFKGQPGEYIEWLMMVVADPHQQRLIRERDIQTEEALTLPEEKVAKRKKRYKAWESIPLVQAVKEYITPDKEKEKVEVKKEWLNKGGLSGVDQYILNRYK